MQVSTGLRNHLLDGGSLKAGMAAGFVKFYSGSMPATADAAVTGTLLSTISQSSGGTGINLGTSSGGAITKDGGEVWSGVNAATGTAGYYRYVAPGDDGTLSTSQKRMQGTCGLTGTDMVMSSVNLVSGATQTIDNATIAMPASP
jgi:hypothetical protein